MDVLEGDPRGRQVARDPRDHVREVLMRVLLGPVQEGQRLHGDHVVPEHVPEETDDVGVKGELLPRHGAVVEVQDPEVRMP